MNNKRMRNLVYICLILVLPTAYADGKNKQQDQANDLRSNNPHYTSAGFFDIHVCNWPNRKHFFMPLFSTTRYNEITGISVYNPDGSLLTSMNLEKYKELNRKGKPKIRVFLDQIDVPNGAKDGWYSATIDLDDGTHITAKDYVVVSILPRPSHMSPSDGAEDITLPGKFTWSSVGEGSYYQIFIRDKWQDSKLIYHSKLIKETEVDLPEGILQPDGLYTWQIHARDINEDRLLGDFNKGAMSNIVTFSTSAE